MGVNNMLIIEGVVAIPFDNISWIAWEGEELIIGLRHTATDVLQWKIEKDKAKLVWKQYCDWGKHLK
jgi:hypothetical protein